MVSVINPKGLSPKILPFFIYDLEEDKENILTGGSLYSNRCSP